jgi:AcrR family transcriptional regulator
MKTVDSRKLRADAARNVERIVAAAREAFAAHGAQAQLDDIARRAGVSGATLYRHFANKEQLINAVVRQRFTDVVEPAIERALGGEDPWHALVGMLEAALTVATEEKGTFEAGGHGMFVELAAQYFDAFTVVLRRAQDAGLVRADVSPEDLPRLTGMLIGTTHKEYGPDDAWRRYLALLLDALRPAAATPLPPLPSLSPPSPRLPSPRPA